MGTCKTCSQTLDQSAFYAGKTDCKECYKAKVRGKNLARYHAKYNGDTPRRRQAELSQHQYIKTLLAGARTRARKKNVPFDLGVSDIVIPEVCPVLGLKLERSNKYDKSANPSLDRVIPERGYVKDNVRVISFLANSLKSSASLDQLRALVRYVEENTGT